MLARGGDDAAYAELVAAHQDVAFRIAMLITANAADAQDAAQDAFIKAHRALHRFRPGEPLRPWLLQIVANEARNRRRSGSRRERLVRAAAMAERRSLLLETITQLREGDRLVIGCRFLLELSEAETARALGCRPGTVKSRLSRALERLRAELGEEDLR